MSELRESVAIRRMKLELLNQNLKLASILNRQVIFLSINLYLLLFYAIPLDYLLEFSAFCFSQ